MATDELLSDEVLAAIATGHVLVADEDVADIARELQAARERIAALEAALKGVVEAVTGDGCTDECFNRQYVTEGSVGCECGAKMRALNEARAALAEGGADGG